MHRSRTKMIWLNWYAAACRPGLYPTQISSNIVCSDPTIYSEKKAYLDAFRYFFRACCYSVWIPSSMLQTSSYEMPDSNLQLFIGPETGPHPDVLLVIEWKPHCLFKPLLHASKAARVGLWQKNQRKQILWVSAVSSKKGASTGVLVDFSCYGERGREESQFPCGVASVEKEQR